MAKQKLIGPFTQVLTMDKMLLKGPLSDDNLEIIPQAGILTEDDTIVETGSFDRLLQHAKNKNSSIEELQGDYVALPGFIDPHTHICWAGSRAQDYALRLHGKSYSEIAAAGGGIWDTVTQTRTASKSELTKLLGKRAERQLHDGVTTTEVKSGYGLKIEDELKILESIAEANNVSNIDLIPTCLAAHICPKDFKGSPTTYLSMIITDLLPKVRDMALANRIDIYIDENAFSEHEARTYLSKVRSMGFEISVHADQFSPGGSLEAIEAGAVSADHLEASGVNEIKMLSESHVIPVALPGSSLGLGIDFAPARELLDAGASLAIGSDWNPGSAPMGDLLVQAAILGMYEKLSIAETLAGISFRAAAALNLKDRGKIKSGKKADFIAFSMNDYREIMYNQGKIKPTKIWKNGKLINTI